MRPDQAFQLLDPDAIANAAQHAGPGLGGVLRRKPRTVIQYSVSAMVPIIGNDSIHLQPCRPKIAILDLWRDRCETRYCPSTACNDYFPARRHTDPLAASTALVISPGHDAVMVWRDAGRRQPFVPPLPSPTAIPQSPYSYQSSPSNSAGCCVRPEPFPQASESFGQYLSHPQQIRSGCFGCKGNTFAISSVSPVARTNASYSRVFYSAIATAI